MSAISSTGTLKKICKTCARQISWRKKWEKNWDSIIYCSDSCRKNKIKLGSLDTIFETTILRLLREQKQARIAGVSKGKDDVVTCEQAEKVALQSAWPQDQDDSVAENYNGDVSTNIRKDPARTRERCRQAARRLVARGEIIITQDGKVSDPSFTKGVMELKLP